MKLYLGGHCLVGYCTSGTVSWRENVVWYIVHVVSCLAGNMSCGMLSVLDRVSVKTVEWDTVGVRLCLGGKLSCGIVSSLENDVWDAFHVRLCLVRKLFCEILSM